MGLRLTVFAALGMGVLVAPCGGFNASNLAKGANVLGNAGDGLAKAEVECKKLDVEPGVKEEYALGGVLAIHFVQHGGGLMLASNEDKKLHTYLNTVGKNLAAQSARPTLEWTFGVLNDSTQVNAVSAPGGYVFVTRKLLQEIDNEGQLAGVLAHEIAHVVLKHSIHKYNEQKVSTCKLAMVGKSVLSPGSTERLSKSKDGDGTLDLDEDPGLLGNLAEKTMNALAKGNEPKLEFEADRMAAQLLVSAGYDPDDYRRLIAKTTEDTRMTANHPKKSERVRKLYEYLDTLKGKEGEFPEVATVGLRSPPLKQPDYAVIRRPVTGVAKDSVK
jgi:hypothetical protein